MRVLASLALGIALSVVTSSTASAGSFITLKDGSIVQGTLVSCSDTELVGMVAPEGDERTFKREEMTPGSWYMVRNMTAGNDAKARMTLAKFCMENGLEMNAQEQLSKVYDLDESMREEAVTMWKQANELAAKGLLDLAEKALSAKNYRSALRLTAKIMTEYDDTASYARAEAMTNELAAIETARPTMKQVIDQPLSDAQVDVMREKDPRYIEAQDLLTRARERNGKGLTAKSQSASKQFFNESLNHYENLRQLADRVLAEEKAQPVIVRRVTAFKEMVTDEMVETYINLAAIDASRTSYPNATQTINEALQRIPGNARLLSYREQILTNQALSSSDNRWRRGRK